MDCYGSIGVPLYIWQRPIKPIVRNNDENDGIEDDEDNNSASEAVNEVAVENRDDEFGEEEKFIRNTHY